MKRITAIEFVNYKAFFQSGEENRIVIPDGKSVLLYGENGSGKSSIYEGLKQFFQSSDNTVETAPARHIRIDRTRIENQGEENETEVPNEVAVKVTFSDANGDEVKTFGIPLNDTQSAAYISQANLLNSFLSYRELLKTYLMENLKDRQEFRLKFAQLIIEGVLAKQINRVTQQTFLKSWNDLFLPRKMYKVENLKPFTEGLQAEMSRINLFLPYLLNYFEEGFSASLVLTESYIEYYHSQKVDREGNYPVCEIDISVFLFGEIVENEDENHLTVLNEARLSSLAISIYLASLINTPQEKFDYKILFLDDIFIGLDMSNRLPLLDILRSFKKPIVEQFVDEQNDGAIVERIQEVNGIVKTDERPFFSDYQIFISTYDRYWFEVAKKEFQAKAQNKWHFLELYANQRDGLIFKTPLLYNSLDYLQKANYHYRKHDYPSCANHLRKALEERLKLLLPVNEHYDEYTDNETGITEIKKLRTLNQYLEKFIKYCDKYDINASELIDLKNLKDWYFNPFSHDNINTPIFTRELDLAKKLVEQIYKFKFDVLLAAGQKLYFDFTHEAQTRNYRIELQENLRWIKSVDGYKLTNPIIQCYEWTRNSEAPQQVTWTINGNSPWKLISFFNNKWKHLLNNYELPDASMARLWNRIYLEGTTTRLIELI